MREIGLQPYRYACLAHVNDIANAQISCRMDYGTVIEWSSKCGQAEVELKSEVVVTVIRIPRKPSSHNKRPHLQRRIQAETYPRFSAMVLHHTLLCMLYMDPILRHGVDSKSISHNSQNSENCVQRSCGGQNKMSCR